MSTLNLHTSAILGRAKDVVDEMNYAQRRLFEIRVGAPVANSEIRLRDEAEREELEALFRLEPLAEDEQN
jgi:hypothetical protein